MLNVVDLALPENIGNATTLYLYLNEVMFFLVLLARPICYTAVYKSCQQSRLIWHLLSLKSVSLEYVWVIFKFHEYKTFSWSLQVSPLKRNLHLQQ